MDFKDFKQGSSQGSVDEMRRFIVSGGVVPLRSEPIGEDRAGVRLWFARAGSGVETARLPGRPALFAPATL